jgi:hypothetical protein
LHNVTRSKLAYAAMLAALLVGVSACEEINWPFHRAQSSSGSAPADAAAGSNGTTSGDSECADLLAQIRDNQESRREAPTTSTNPDIVNAAQGKADKRIDDLQQRYDQLDCPSADSDAARRPGRQPPLQPAPGAVNR